VEYLLHTEVVKCFGDIIKFSGGHTTTQDQAVITGKQLPYQVLATWRRGLWTPGFDAAAGSLALVIAAIAMVRNL
jgi:hypothetical protein